MKNTEYQAVSEEEALKMLSGSGKLETQKFTDFIKKTQEDEAEAEKVKKDQEAFIERQKQIEQAKKDILENPEQEQKIGENEKTFRPPKLR